MASSSSLAAPSPAPQVAIPYASFPHIVESALSFADYPTLLRLRQTCTTLRDKADQALCDDTLVVSEGATGVEMRSGVGVLPFRREAGWACALSRCRSLTLPSSCLTGAQDGLGRALGALPPTAAVHIAHTAHAGPAPAFALPALASLSVALDPLCDCASKGAAPTHGAARVTLALRDRWDKAVSMLCSPCCQVATYALPRAVEQLTLSLVSLRDLRFVLEAILEGRSRCPFRNPALRVRVLVREAPAPEERKRLRASLARRLGLPADRVEISQHAGAGISAAGQ